MTEKLSQQWLRPGVVIGVVVLVGFGALVWRLAVGADVPEEVWSRRLLLFQSVEAIVFAAAGALFGTEVQRRQVRQAVDTAQKQSDRADRHAADAAGGRALARAVKSVGSPGSGAESAGGAAPLDRLKSLSSMAAELFPEV